jgi:hypothetical protein
MLDWIAEFAIYKHHLAPIFLKVLESHKWGGLRVVLMEPSCFLCNFEGPWIFKLQKPVPGFRVKKEGVRFEEVNATKKWISGLYLAVQSMYR